MAYRQIFRGVLELASAAGFESAAEAALRDPDESGAREALARAAVSDKVYVVDVDLEQSATRWGQWSRLLSELAARSVRGYVVSVLYGDEIELEVHAASEAAAPLEPDAAAGRWLPLEVGARWVFERHGAGSEVSWSVAAGADGALSVRAGEGEAYNDVLGTRHLVRRGAAIFDAEGGDEQPWIDLSAEPGSAWLVHRGGQQLLRVSRFVGRADVEVPAGRFAARHYTLSSYLIGTDASDHAPEPELLRPSVVDLYLAADVGPVKVAGPDLTLELLRAEEAPGGAAAAQELPLPELPLPEPPPPEPAQPEPPELESAPPQPLELAPLEIELTEPSLADSASPTLPELAAPGLARDVGPPASTGAEAERAAPPTEDEAPESRWPRLKIYFGREFKLLAALFVIVGVGWMLIHTPTMAGLKYHEMGADDPAPTVIVLHGYGAPGTDFVPLGERMAAQLEGLRVLCVEAPFGVGFGNAWYLSNAQRVRTAAQLSRFVRELEEDGTPRDQMVIAGFSQGAAMATDVSVLLPGLAGVAILSGDFSTHEPLHGRVFISHGRADGVLSFGPAERYAAIYEETAEVTFVPFDGGHEARPIQDDFIRWVGETLALE